jgi:hypothetical protein
MEVRRGPIGPCPLHATAATVTADLIPDRRDGLGANWDARFGGPELVVTDHADATVPGNEFIQRILFRSARGEGRSRDATSCRTRHSLIKRVFFLSFS